MVTDPGSPTLAVTGALVLTAPGARPEPLTILIRDGAIVDLQASTAPLPAGAMQHDARGCLVIPGLVNAHYHSHDVLARGMFEDIALELWIAQAILPGGTAASARAVRLRTLLGGAENLLNGVTTVQDMLGTAPGGQHVAETALRAYAELGIRVVMGLQVGNRPPIDCLPGMDDVLPADLRPLLDPPQASTATILEFVEAPLRRPAVARRHWAIAPGAPQRCTFELLAGLGDLARNYQLPLVTHVNESKVQVVLAEELYAEHGGSVLDYLAATGVLNDRLVMAHGVWFSPAEIDRIAASGATIATNPASNLKLKNGLAPHLALHRAGVPLALGCDNVSAGDTQNMFEAMRLLALTASGRSAEPAGFGAAEILKIATEGGAAALSLEAEIGSIAPGRRADLTLLDLASPAFIPLNEATRQLVYAETGRGVRDVFVDGALVVAGGKLHTVDMAELAADAADLSAQLRRDHADHIARVAPALPYIAEVVRQSAARPLPFDRWLES